jgi:hypothetical protein
LSSVGETTKSDTLRVRIDLDHLCVTWLGKKLELKMSI